MFTVTLSLVMTDCGRNETTCSRRSMSGLTRSMNGMTIASPGSSVRLIAAEPLDDARLAPAG